MATRDKLPEVPWSFLAERVSDNKLAEGMKSVNAKVDAL
jgi:hypothetical protein